MISMRLKGLERFAKGMDRFGKKLAPLVARDSVNAMAFEARKAWVNEIGQKMTLRNRYTTNSIRVEKAKRGPIDGMQAVLGSTAPYMDEQEFGATKQIGGRTAIPTSAAAGQYGARPRTKLVRRPYRLGAVKGAVRGRGLSKGQRNAVAVKTAAAARSRLVILEGRRGKGIFRLVGGARNPKPQMLWNLALGSRPIPANPTLGPAVVKTEARAGAIFRRSMLRQLRAAFGRAVTGR